MTPFEKLREEYKEKYGDVTCVHCGRPAFDNCYSEYGLKEVLISEFCEKCFDAMFGGEEE